MANTEARPNFSSFPSEEHVKNVCMKSPTREGCRYLSMTMGVMTCEKSGHLREILDERVKTDSIRSKGDNCAGTLGFINDNQSSLVGNKTRYHEVGLDGELEGKFESLEIKNGMVTIKDGKSNLVLNEEILLIEVDSEGITFTARGLGAFVGETKILFEKPRA